MKILWMAGGAMLGRAFLGRKGMIAGAAAGYFLAPARKVEAPEVGVAAEGRAAPPSSREGEAAGKEERYPEETIIDAMREDEEEAAETARRGEETV